MALETGTYISDLVATNPEATDDRDEGDDHLRLIKSTIKATFPNVTGAVTVTQAELNALSGVTASVAELNILDGVTGVTSANINHLSGTTSAIQTQLNTKANGNFTIEAKTDSFTAVAFYHYILRTNSTRTATLPTSATASQEIIISNTTAGNWTVARNGHNIMGAAANDTLAAGDSSRYIYVDSTTGWARMFGNA